MKMKTVIILAFAVGCGLIAMMGVQQMIAKQNAGTEDQPVKVLVASIDIPPGVLLNENNSEFKEYPANLVPGDAILSKEDYVDRGLLVPISSGDIIRQAKLGGRGEINASASIPVGMRTISIQVNDTKTHSGLLQPGDRVDLQISYDVRNREGAMISKTATLLEYIEVFAADSIRNLEAGESKEIKAKNITLLATSDQAELIQLADKQGDLLPIMRSKEDDILTISPEEQMILVAELKTGVLQEAGNFEDPSLGMNNNSKETPMSAAQAFKSFLNNEVAEPPQTTSVPEQPEEPEIDEHIWIIQVYAGDEVTEQEVTVPVSLTEETNQLGEQSNQTGTSSFFSGDMIKGLLNSFFPPPRSTITVPKTKDPETAKPENDQSQNRSEESLSSEQDKEIPVEM